MYFWIEHLSTAAAEEALRGGFWTGDAKPESGSLPPNTYHVTVPLHETTASSRLRTHRPFHFTSSFIVIALSSRAHAPLAHLRFPLRVSCIARIEQTLTH